MSNVIAKDVTCKPTENSRWTEIKITNLKDGSRNFLKQVKGMGDYLGADLICHYKDCVGFINGNIARGSIEISLGSQPQITGFSFHDNEGVSEKFICE